MPAPDIQYFLDCSAICGQIAPDTYTYFMEVCPNTNEIIDSYDGVARFEPIRRHSDTLMDMGLWCEEHYVAWRKQNPEMAHALSATVLPELPQFIAGRASEDATGLINKGYRTLTREAVGYLADKYQFASRLGVMRRFVHRLYADLSAMSANERRAAASRIEDVRRASAEALRLELERLRARHRIRIDEKKSRQALKRSIKFFQGLMGEPTTRLFLSGEKLRIEGRHAIYEIARSGGRMGHGSTQLSVFTKQDDIHLCDLCIYTPTVPMLDHVASIVMHIQSGEEEHILDVGNSYNTSKQAYDQEWLVPFIPRKISETEHIISPSEAFNDPEFRVDRSPARKIKIARLKKRMMRFYLDDVCQDQLHALRIQS